MCEGPLHTRHTSFVQLFFFAHFIDEFYLCVGEICNNSSNNNCFSTEHYFIIKATQLFGSEKLRVPFLLK